jgi:hypothetical protein
MMKRARSADQLETAINQEIERITAARERIDTYVVRHEANLSGRVLKLGELVQEYNGERLSPIIDFLIEKGLAYYGAGEGLLVRESELEVKTESGLEERWRGSEYNEYTETVPYRRTYLRMRDAFADKGIQITEGTSIREAWTISFRKRFAGYPSRSLPGWLLVALDQDKLPPDPIEVASYRLPDQELARLGLKRSSVSVSRPGGPSASVVCREPEKFHRLRASVRR